MFLLIPGLPNSFSSRIRSSKASGASSAMVASNDKAGCARRLMAARLTLGRLAPISRPWPSLRRFPGSRSR
jgi:hypothetical protein